MDRKVTVTKAMGFVAPAQAKYAHRKTLTASRRMALTSHTCFHSGFSSMLVSLCSRAAFSSGDRLALGPLDRPHNHKYSIFQQGGLAAEREEPERGCWDLLGLFPPSSQSFGWAMASLEWGLRGTLREMKHDGKKGK